MLRKLEHQRSNTGRLVTQHRLKEWVKIQFSQKDETKNEVNNDRKKKDVDNIDISDSMSLALRHGSEDSIMLQQLDSDYEKRKSDSRRNKKRRNSGFIDSIEEILLYEEEEVTKEDDGETIGTAFGNPSRSRVAACIRSIW